MIGFTSVWTLMCQTMILFMLSIRLPWTLILIILYSFASINLFIEQFEVKRVRRIFSYHCIIDNHSNERRNYHEFLRLYSSMNNCLFKFFSLLVRFVHERRVVLVMNRLGNSHRENEAVSNTFARRRSDSKKNEIKDRRSKIRSSFYLH